MRIALVCPYSYEVPGGVQWHVRDLAAHLAAQGHATLVLAPGPATVDEIAPGVPLVGIGRALPVRWNGSVARVALGPRVSSHVRRRLEQWRPDLVHVHEPAAPSLSLAALAGAPAPVVGTFHTATTRLRPLSAAGPLLRPRLDLLSASIAVSPSARRTLAGGLGGDAIVIPNGVDTAAYAGPPQHRSGPGLRLAFLGRALEPRKGLPVLLDAVRLLLGRGRDVRLDLIGPGGDLALAQDRTGLPPGIATAHGAVDDPRKAALLRSADALVAPNLGGESFGITLVEAMAAGAPVVASDLTAFADVLSGAGLLVPAGDASALAAALAGLAAEPGLREELRRAGRRRAAEFDWARVGAEITGVYETVLAGARSARPALPGPWLARPHRARPGDAQEGGW